MENNTKIKIGLAAAAGLVGYYFYKKSRPCSERSGRLFSCTEEDVKKEHLKKYPNSVWYDSEGNKHSSAEEDSDTEQEVRTIPNNKKIEIKTVVIGLGVVLFSVYVLKKLKK